MFENYALALDFEELIEKINDGKTEKLTTGTAYHTMVKITPDNITELSDALRGNKTLKNFAICYSEKLADNKENFVALVDALSTTHLESLTFIGCKIEDSSATEIAKLLTPPIKAEGADVEQPHKVQLKFLNLDNNEIKKEGAEALAAALEENQHLETFILSRNNPETEGALAFANTLGKNNTLRYIDLNQDDNIEADASKKLDNAIIANKKIVRALYKSISFEARMELYRRESNIRRLIKKWHSRDHSTFTEYELATLYNNKDSIEFMNKFQLEYPKLLYRYEQDEYSIDFPQFYAELCSRIYPKWWVGEALEAGFAQGLKLQSSGFDPNIIESIVSIWTKTDELTGFKISAEDEKIQQTEKEQEELEMRKKYPELYALKDQIRYNMQKMQEELDALTTLNTERKNFQHKVIFGYITCVIGVGTFGAAMLTLTKMASVSNIASILLPPPVKVAVSVAVASIVLAKCLQKPETQDPAQKI